MEDLWHTDSKIFSQKYSSISSGVCGEGVFCDFTKPSNFSRCLFLSSASPPFFHAQLPVSWQGCVGLCTVSGCALCSLCTSAYAVIRCNALCPLSWWDTPTHPFGAGSMTPFLKGDSLSQGSWLCLSLSCPVLWDTLPSQTWALFTMPNLFIASFPRQWRVP